MDTKSFKALGPNGFQPFFFKHYYNLVGDNLWHLVCDAFLHSSIDPRLVKTLIILTYKTDKLVHLKKQKFQPINFCNVIYKVITNVMTKRLWPYLDEIIGAHHRGFIPERRTTNNIIMAQGC